MKQVLGLTNAKNHKNYGKLSSRINALRALDVQLPGAVINHYPDYHAANLSPLTPLWRHPRSSATGQLVETAISSSTTRVS